MTPPPAPPSVVAPPRPLGRTGVVLLLVCAAAAFAALVSLGTWQMHRLAWKEALIAHVTERLAAAPVPLPPPEEWPALRPEDYEFRKVVLSGHFLHDREVHVSITLSEPNGPFGGIGYFVVTPFVLEGAGEGRIVLVNRGFVPNERKDPATRPAGEVAGTVALVGLMRPPDAGNPFTPDPDPVRNIWFARDPARIAAALDLEGAAPFTVDDTGVAPGGLPQGGETIVAFPNSHLQYAVTWYGLAAALVGVTAAFLVRQRRITRES